MKKILHVVEGMNAGGMESLIMSYYRKIDKKKYQFDFLINTKEKVFFEDEINKLGGHIYRNVLPKENFVENRKQLDDFFKNHHYDVIHCHQGITYYHPLKVAKKYNVPNRIVHNHGINRNFLKYLFVYNELWAKKRISSLGNNYVSCSKEVLNHLFTNKIIKNKNYTILPNAIDTKKFNYNIEARKKIREEFSIKNERVFLHIGTFTTPKNHDFLINIFNEYLKIDNTSILLLVGDGPLKENIASKVNSLGIDKNVIFVSTRTDIPDILSASDIMLFPSLYEGLPLTLIEAQSSGIIIFTSTGVSRECNLTDKISFLNIDDTSIWVESIRNADLNYNRNEYNKILSKSDFNIDNSTKLLEQLYERKI